MTTISAKATKINSALAQAGTAAKDHKRLAARCWGLLGFLRDPGWKRSADLCALVEDLAWAGFDAEATALAKAVGI